ncbi:hypothetical protein FTZ03_22890 [Salmonella enterica]|nr:hypothetical protein [Salmonella enterica]
MTRLRVCPDTEFTGLSPAADALPETAIISDTGVPLLNTLICPPDTFKARPAAQAAHGSRRQWYVINPRRMNRCPGTGLLCRTRMSSSATPVLMSVSLAICWSARDRYSAVCWPGPAGQGDNRTVCTGLFRKIHVPADAGRPFHDGVHLLPGYTCGLASGKLVSGRHQVS